MNDGSCLENDCNGLCGGDAVLDDCEVCGGDNTACLDCAGVVNGTSILDDCGVCGGDGSSCAEVPGCTEELACNYNVEATVNDGSCLENDCNGLCGGDAVLDDCEVCGGDNTACLDCAGVVNGTSILDDCGVCGGDGSSCAEVPGCTEELACNYNPAATISDDSCQEAVLVFIPTDIEDFGPAVIACEAPQGYILADQDCVNAVILNDEYCLTDFWDEICQDAYDCCLGGVVGCTDETASNYDPTATCDDDSCEYDGCNLVCPNDLNLECGSDVSISATGTPFYQGDCFFGGLEEWPYNDLISGDACLTIIERTCSWV